jgi:hypothetical protein
LARFGGAVIPKVYISTPAPAHSDLGQREHTQKIGSIFGSALDTLMVKHVP